VSIRIFVRDPQSIDNTRNLWWYRQREHFAKAPLSLVFYSSSNFLLSHHCECSLSLWILSNELKGSLEILRTRWNGSDLRGSLRRNYSNWRNRGRKGHWRKSISTYPRVERRFLGLYRWLSSITRLLLSYSWRDLCLWSDSWYFMQFYDPISHFRGQPKLF